MATKQTVEERQRQIEELAAREKDKTITREEKYLLSELREMERRRKKNILLAKERKALAAGKKEALQKILDSVGIATENQLKDILRFVMASKSELIPKMPEPEKKEAEQPDDADAGDQAEPEDAKTEAVPTCETCGAALIEKTAKDGRHFLGCPNWRPGEKHTTRDIDELDRENRSA